MEGVPLFEVSKLLRHAIIQMTERYAHLAPDHLHAAVASIKFSAHQLGVPTPHSGGYFLVDLLSGLNPLIAV